MPTVYLIDGSSYIYRAFHAIREGLSNSRGLPTNATFGFTRMLTKLLEEKKPGYLGIFFDRKEPTFRHERYPAYKANRPPMPEDLVVQLPYIRKVVDGFRIPVFEQAGFEADDLMGAMALKAADAGFEVILVTGDKDYLQIVGDRVTIWDPMKDRVTDLSRVTAEFGISPRQMIDVMGLSGDTSDNIPGVPGIGPKTALKLIQTHGSMEGLYEKFSGVTDKQKEKLLAFRDQAFLSRDLCRIRTDAPVEFTPDGLALKPPDAAALAGLFQELEFRQFADRFQESRTRHEKAYHTVTDADALGRLVSRLSAADIFALDTETTSPDPMRARLVGMSFSCSPHEAFYIPVGHDYFNAPEQLGREEVFSALKPLLENPDARKVGQNIKYDWIVLNRCGMDLKGIAFDTMVASYLIDPGKRTHSLDRIAADFLGYPTISYESVAGKGRQARTFDQVPVAEAAPYACQDADITRMAHAVLKRELASLDLTALMETVEMPLIPVLKDMEMTGVTVDRDHLKDLSKSFERQLQGLETDIYAAAGETFNIKSSQQIGVILFDKLGLPVQKKTQKKTGYSTDVEVLTVLAGLHELPALILRHRTLSKLKSTYADALVELIHPETGRIHTSYNQTVTATGRLSSSDPNLQNIPIRTEEGVEIRRAFVPRKGWRFLAADYSQIELRLLAHYSGDDTLIRAFLNEEDIHTRTAAEIFHADPERITQELRRQAKTINFGIIYGMGPFSLSKELGISQVMAATYIKSYFDRYPGVQAFIDRTIAEARRTERTSTLLGRIRRIPEISSMNRNIRGFAERTAVNTPIQGTAADFIKLAMVRAASAIKNRGLRSAMLLSVHDELVFESPPEEIEPMKLLVRDVMETVWPDLRVPLKVNMGTGENWAEAH